MGQPQFTTPRLHMRPAVPEDLAALHVLWNHPQVRRYLFDDQPVTREHAAAVLSDRLVLAPRGLGLWIVEARDAAGCLGCIGLCPVTVAADHEPAIAGLLELLVALQPAHWGRGHARESLAPLIGYAFDVLGQATIAGVTDVPNVDSQRMLHALGFQRLSETAGSVHRQLNFLLHREDWRPSPP